MFLHRARLASFHRPFKPRTSRSTAFGVLGGRETQITQQNYTFGMDGLGDSMRSPTASIKQQPDVNALVPLDADISAQSDPSLL
jgi:hypothetical protein